MWLSCSLDLYLVEYLKCLVYVTSVYDVAELQQHMENVCETIREKAKIF
jgi:hypothetical protein